MLLKKNHATLFFKEDGCIKIFFRRFSYYWSFVYRKHVQLNFPIERFRHYHHYDSKLPEGYRMCSLSECVDVKEWADLLNLDEEFGQWTVARVKSEISDHLIAPDAATFIYFGEQLVGCVNTKDISTTKQKIGMGNWLFVHPAHRGKKLNLAFILTFHTMAYCIREGCAKVIAVTDPCRLSALYLYLSNGVEPEYNSLYSFWLWWNIKRRLKLFFDRDKMETGLSRLNDSDDRLA